MAKKKNSVLKEWLKKNWFFLLAFAPVIQWIPCFVMNGKARKKRWLFMGIAYIAIGLGAFVGYVVVQDWTTNSYVSYPKGPSEDDYRDFSYNTYKDSNGVIDWDSYYKAVDEWERTEEYDKYQEDLDAYFASPEYIAVSNANSRRYRIQEIASVSLALILSLKYFIYMAWIYFVERYRYLDAVRETDRKQQIYRNIAGSQPQSRQNIQDNWKNISDNATATPVAAPAPIRVESDVVPDTAAGILNVNIATEAQLSALPLINVVDAKRIIAYRDTNGSFKTKDEFFECFNAKPHVIVKLQDSITVDSDVKVKKAAKPKSTPNKPRFDL